MQNRSVNFMSFAGVLILAVACSGDNPVGPDAPSQNNSSGAPLGSTIAGNAIATVRI
jgi:hypothetical protein